MNIFWHRSENFGDNLNPWLFDKMNIRWEYVEKGHPEAHIIGCGSIISAANENSIIWGSGIADSSQEMVKPKMILAVRGLLTLQYLRTWDIYVDPIICDPAYLLPLYIEPSPKKRELGIIHHQVDGGDIITRSIEEVVEYITSSDRIITGSLHAAICASAYGIPYDMIRSRNVICQDYKWKDFEMSKHLYDAEKLRQAIYEIRLLPI